MRFLAWLFSMIFAFNLGAGVNSDKPADSELEQKIRDHMDVIVDESAAMMDDIADEFRNNEHVKEAEAFAEDVREIVDNTKQDIEDHFGKPAEETTETEPAAEPEAAGTEQTAEPEAAAPETAK